MPPSAPTLRSPTILPAAAIALCHYFAGCHADDAARDGPPAVGTIIEIDAAVSTITDVDAVVALGASGPPPKCAPGSVPELKPGMPEESALLPGESTDCAALGIVACSSYVSDGCNEEDWSYRCFDASGKEVQWACHYEYPCSEAQLDQWSKAYHACWKMVPANAMPLSPSTAVLDPSKVPASVCANIDGWVFQFVAFCALHKLAFEPMYGVASMTDLPDWWILEITPPTTAALRVADYPFLACSNFEAGTYESHSIEVEKTDQSHWLEFDNSQSLLRVFAVAEDGDKDPTSSWWGPWLDEVASSFTTCEAKYWKDEW